MDDAPISKVEHRIAMVTCVAICVSIAAFGVMLMLQGDWLPGLGCIAVDAWLGWALRGGAK